MRNIVWVIVVVVAFFAGGIIGRELGYKKMGEQQKQETDQLKSRNPNLDKAITEKESLENEMAKLKDDYEKRLAKEKEARKEAEDELEDVEKELENVKTALAKATPANPESQKKKKSAWTPMIKTQIGKKYKERIGKLKEKSPLSVDQEEAIGKLVDSEAERMAELTGELMSGEKS